MNLSSLTLAHEYLHYLLSLVVQLVNLCVGVDENSDLARRFITLVDELYNRGGRLYCSASVPVEELFSPEGSGYTPEQYLEMAEQFQFEAEAYVNARLACGQRHACVPLLELRCAPANGHGCSLMQA